MFVFVSSAALACARLSVTIFAHTCINYLCLHRAGCSLSSGYVYVVVNFLSQVIFVFLLFLGMVMYANEVETKEK